MTTIPGQTETTTLKKARAKAKAAAYDYLRKVVDDEIQEGVNPRYYAACAILSEGRGIYTS